MSKTVSILGSTGSVGRNALDVIRKLGGEDFKITSLVAGSNYKLLCKQAIEFKVKSVVIADETYFRDVKDILCNYDIQVLAGTKAIQEVCALASDFTIAAISGIAGLASIYDSITNGSDIILANKESMICAGNLLLEHVEKYNRKIIPIDSEHNAIFQVFDEQNKEAIDNITLTCSGGPFRGYTKEMLKSVDVRQALNHPKWKMGKKITIDSATLFNKGLEVIEACYLFGIPIENVKVLIHKESTIHGLVQYKDGSVLAQMGCPDMRIPICNALYYPNRYNGMETLPALNLLDVGILSFEEIDNAVFPSIELCKSAFNKGEQSLILLNASNEVAVKYFLNKKIKFLDIFKIVDTLLEKIVFVNKRIHSVEDILSLDQEFRTKTEEFIRKVF